MNIKRHTSQVLGALLLLATLVTPPAQAQTFEDALRFTDRYAGTGARLMGMGGASIGGIADYGALFTNPAGLGYFRSSSLSGSLGTLNINDASVFAVGNTSSPLENDISATNLTHFAYVYKVPTVRGSLVFAAGYNQIHSFERSLLFRGSNGVNSITDFFMPVSGEFSIDQGAGDDGMLDTADDTFTPSFSRDLSFIAFETFAIDFDRGLFDDGDTVPFLPAVVTGNLTQTGRVVEEGSMQEINVGFSVEASKGVLFGLSLNIPVGTYSFARTFEEDDVNNDNDGANSVTDGQGRTILTTDFNYLRFDERFESDLAGINLRAGFSANIGSGLRAGLTIETPTYYSLEETFSTALETEFDNGDFFSYGGFAGDDAGSGSFEYNIITPWRFGAGLVFEASNLLLSGDLEFVDWSQLELDEESGLLFIDENQFIKENLQSVINVRLGAEVGLGNLALRGGVAFDPDPRDLDTPTTQADGSDLDRLRTTFSAGFGYQFTPQFAVDFGWSHTRFDDQYAPYTEVLDAPIVDEEITRNRFNVGVRLNF